MTPQAFQAFVLSLPRVRERAILGSQEFRILDKVFATLGWPQAGWAVVKLEPQDQVHFISQCRGLSPEPGGRGRRGVTRVRLADVDEATIKSILKAAWRLAGGASPIPS